MTVSVVVWGDAAGLTERLERLRGEVTVVRQCEELTEVLALAETGLADAALLAGPADLVDAGVVDGLRQRGVAVLALSDDGDQRSRLEAVGASVDSPESSAQAIADLLELLVSSAEAAGTPRRGPFRSLVPQSTGPVRQPGRILAVWGSPGSPGRTTLAVNLAAEAAIAGRDVLLVDADTYGASIAVHLGLLDESAGIAQLCRLSDQGMLDADSFGRACTAVAVAGARLRVATGLPRASRWPELRTGSLGRVLEMARGMAELVVVDVAPYLELDEDLSFDTAAPQRNAATRAVLDAADEILAVGRSDSVGVPRLVKAVEELGEILPDAEPGIVFNRVRSAAVGSMPERQLRDTWERFGPRAPVAGFVPYDADTVDAALLAGTVLAESAAGGTLRSAVAQLAGVQLQRRAGLFRRRGRTLASFPDKGR